MRRCIAVSSTSLFFLLAACADGPTHSGDSESSSTGFPDEEPGAFGSACPEGGLDPDRVYASIFTEELSASVMLLVDIEQAENGCAYASNSNEELGDSIVRASDGAFVQSVGGVGSSAGFYAFPSAPPPDLHAEDEFGQLDAQGRLVMNLHRTETGVELRTVERADLEHHEVLLSGPYFDAPPTMCIDRDGRARRIGDPGRRCRSARARLLVRSGRGREAG